MLVLACGLSAQAVDISGRVGNLLTGSPVRKAQVILNPGGRTAVTDIDGRYTMKGIAPGRYKLSVERPGFLPTTYGAHGPNRPGKSLVVAAGDAMSNIDFTLEPPAVITGHIYDADGEPLSASVQVWRETFSKRRRSIDQVAAANADDGGEYRVYGLPAGRYFVAAAQAPAGFGEAHLREVYPQTFYPGSEEISGASALTLAPGGEARNIDLHLQKTAAVTVGIEIEGATTPNQNVSITMEGRDRKTTLRGNTNAGVFRMTRVTPGSYTVHATSQAVGKQFFASTDVDVGTLDAEGVRLTLVPALDVSGTVRSDFDPSSLTVALSDSDVVHQQITAKPDADGKFTWTGLQPGSWMLSIGPIPEGTYLKSSREIQITAEGRKPVEIVLSSDGASLEGAVTNPGPVEGATVLLVADGVEKFAITEADGKFALHGIPPGNYRLLAVQDLETQSWNDPQVLKQFDGKGVVLVLAPRQQAVQALTPTP